MTGQLIVGDFTVSQVLLSTANPQLSYTAPSSLVYDGTAKSYTPVFSIPVDFTYSYSGTNTTAYGPSPTAPSSVGDYVLTAFPNSPNYAEPSPIAFSITPAPISLIAPTNFVYSGLPKSYGATAAGSPVFLFTYGGTNSTTYGPATSAPTNAGSYTLSVTVPSAGSNYSPSTANFTITPVDAPSDSITITPPASLVYTATAKTFTASAPGASDFTYTYTGAGATTYGPSANAPTNVGSYQLLVSTLAGDPNHTQSRGLAFNITPRPLTVTATALIKQLGAADPVLTYTTAGLQGSDVLTGTLTREAGESLASYAITRGSLSASTNYSFSYTGANFRIGPSLAFMLSTTKSDVLQTSTDTVLALAGANIRGLACDGTNLYVNSGGTKISVYGFDGSLISANDVANLPANHNQMAYAGGHLYARNGENLYLISTTDWTSTLVSVDPSHPMLWVPADYLGGSLFDTPDGKIGMMGPVSSDGATFIVRIYTVSGDGLTLTWDHDATIDNNGWNPNEHGTATDGIHLYRLDGSGVAAPNIVFTSVYEEPYVDEWDVPHGGMWTTTVSYGALPSGETLQLVSVDLYHTYGPRGGSWDGWSDFNDAAVTTLSGGTAGGSFTATTTSEVTGVIATAPAGSSGGSGYKSYNLASGTLAYDGTGWTPPEGFVAPTFLTRNHVTGQLIVGDLSASQVLLSAATTQLPATTVVSLVYDGTGQNCTTSLSGASGFSYLYEGRNETTYASSARSPVNVGDYTLIATPTAPGAGGAIRVNFSITPKTITVTAEAKSKTYGAADPALTYLSSGLIGSDTITGGLTRVAGGAAGIYTINQGSLTAGANYAIIYTSADLRIEVTLDELLSIQKTRALQASTDTVLALEGVADVRGLACDGTNLYVNSGGTKISVYRLDGSLVSSHAVGNLPPHYNQMAYAGGHLFARNGTNLYLISTTDWTSTPVSVDATHPLLWIPAGYLGGSLFDTPDGKIGMMGPISEDRATFIVRMFTVSGDGLSLTWERDYTMVNNGWGPDEHGMATDGDYFYRLAGLAGYKSYDLATGEVTYDGGSWRQPAGFLDPIFLTRNHRTGQLIVGDLYGSQVLLSAVTGIVFTPPASLVYSASPKVHTATVMGVSGFSYRYSGRNGTVYASSSTAPTNVGDYTITATSTDENHAGSKSLNFSITPKSVTVSADAKSKLRGAVNPALTYTAEGLLGSDRLSGNLDRATGEAAGTYAILPGTLAGSNYAISYTGADLTIIETLLPPTSFLASPTNNQRANLSWISSSSSNSARTGYTVSYSLSGANSWTGISLPANAMSCSVTNLMAGTTYDFRIASVSGDETSAHVTNRATTWTTQEEWRFANFGTINNSGNAADDAAPAGDGIKNLTKYALGIEPSGANSPDVLNMQVDTDRRLTLSFKRARPELTYTVEGSSDLRTWSNVVVNPGLVGATVTVTDSAPTNARSRFLRLKISR